MITKKHQIETRHLRYFHVLSETLNFRKAAETLNIAQPGLSRQIKHLEDQLDTQLFIRDKRSVQLTLAGEYLQNESRFLINHLETIRHQIKHIAKGQKGEIRIGYVGSAMQTVAPDIVKSLYENYPDITTSLAEMDNQEQVNKITNDEMDLGFVRLQAVPESLVLVPLHVDSFSVALPMDHPLNSSTFQSIEQLANEDFILFSSEYSPFYYDKIISICEDKGFHPKVSLKSVHAYTIFKLVESKMGVAIIPTSLQTGYNLGVKFLEIPRIRQNTILSAIWSKKSRNPALSSVTNIIKQKGLS
jgi:DNA-binding transcriptional LysR family regulator